MRDATAAGNVPTNTEEVDVVADFDRPDPDEPSNDSELDLEASLAAADAAVAVQPAEDAAVEETEALAALVLEEDRAYAQISKRKSDEGVWVDLPKLGAKAEGRICRVGNSAYSELWSKAGRKYGGKSGIIPIHKREELLPVVYARTMLVGIRGVRLQDATGRAVSEVKIEVKVGHNWVDRIYKFVLDDDGYVVDNEANRINLLRLFSPSLQDDVYKLGNEEERFVLAGGISVPSRDDLGKASGRG